MEHPLKMLAPCCTCALFRGRRYSPVRADHWVPDGVAELRA